MRLLQTQGIVFLVPMLLALVVGAVVYPMGLWRAGIATAWPYRLGVTAVVFVVIGRAVAVGFGQGRQAVVLVFLALLALAYGWTGYDIAVSEQ